LGPDTADAAAPLVSADSRLFTAVSLGRAPQAIVEQVRALLREGRLGPGDRLPSERELCRRFEVSRVTVREALRILETAGLISIKVGARGGAFVTTPTSDRLGAGLADLLALSPMTATEVTEARLVFELGIVPLVVERATAADVAALRDLTDEHLRWSRVGKYTMDMSAAFHTAVGAATHNNAVAMLVRSFHRPLLMSLREAHTLAPEMGVTGVTEHAAFVDAIAARDLPGAEEIIRTHLGRTIHRLSG
jgi:GntR family transcriptional regulator, transcriptional repressor for pyruvate dehydrogenase complex